MGGTRTPEQAGAIGNSPGMSGPLGQEESWRTQSQFQGQKGPLAGTQGRQRPLEESGDDPRILGDLQHLRLGHFRGSWGKEGIFSPRAGGTSQGRKGTPQPWGLQGPLPAAGTPQGQAEASTPVALPQTEIISPCPCPPSPPSRAMGPCWDLRLDPLGQAPDPVSVRDSPRGVWGPPTAGPGTPPHSGSRWPYWGMNRTRGRWNTQSPPAPGLGWK